MHRWPHKDQLPSQVRWDMRSLFHILCSIDLLERQIYLDFDDFIQVDENFIPLFALLLSIWIHVILHPLQTIAKFACT